MGTYLTDDEIELAREELRIVYAMPYHTGLAGPAWEQIFAAIKGGAQTSETTNDDERWRRDNRAKPDVIVQKDGSEIRYSLKTEALRRTKERRHAQQFLGFYEDLIIARPKVDDLLAGQAIDAISADELGALVLRYYNERIVTQFRWDIISCLLRLDDKAPYEFIYWEEKPVLYDPAGYWWKDSGKATGSNRNINGYPRTIDPTLLTLPRATFKFTSGGKQFYILYQIPQDADIWVVEKATLSEQEVREALRDLLRRQAAQQTDQSPDA
jgi:hypothetical protein